MVEVLVKRPFSRRLLSGTPSLAGSWLTFSRPHPLTAETLKSKEYSMVSCLMGPGEGTGSPSWSGNALVDDDSDPTVVRDKKLLASGPPGASYIVLHKPAMAFHPPAANNIAPDIHAESNKLKPYSGLYASSVSETFGGPSAFSVDGNVAQSPSDVQISERETEAAVSPGDEVDAQKSQSLTSLEDQSAMSAESGGVLTPQPAEIYTQPSVAVSQPSEGAFWPSSDSIGSLGLEGITAPTNVKFPVLHISLSAHVASKLKQKKKLERRRHRQMERSYGQYLHVPHLPAALSADDVALHETSPDDHMVLPSCSIQKCHPTIICSEY
ncbi:hypothetical protein SISNIDRAFT_485362 [Sistotremastrum niveocremeum HHB9708]|uniref:Uncharacterized protein n=1 Tax=Sistotremastrum niveocremeum HHB9708 TaxID=1314777 RepID=A0A164V2I5_9AGAM|nr:hypothetical protein SISNIDRAFT_485362 [Sistotremastrum niveocremeum HHB9708]